MGIDTIHTEISAHEFIESLFYNYYTLIIRIAQKYVFNMATAEDILQDAFLQITRKADYLQKLPSDKIVTYLILMVRGLCVDYLRKSHRKNQADISDEAILSMLDQSCLSKDNLASELKKAELFMLLRKLPADDQFLLIGHYYLQLSITDLSAHLGSSTTSIRTRLHRAKKRAYETWKNSGLSMEDFLV